MSGRYEGATVLSLGARGRHAGTSFVLCGRSVVRSTTGGVWNEWTMRFADGRTAFLAEAAGAFTVFEQGALAPALAAAAAPGAPLDTGFVVTERGVGARVASWGETLEAPKKYGYVDLSSRDGRAATIDYGDTPPRSFVGRRVSLSALGLSPRPEPPRFFAAPRSPQPKGLKLWFDVGDIGALDGARFRVVGVLHRSLRSGRDRFAWEEYVLFEPTLGFRWLVLSEGHFSLVRSVEVGAVEETARGAVHEGTTYRLLGAGVARIEWAAGELPWEASVGDEVDVRDYVHAPHMLSREATANELTWSRGEWIQTGIVARAFGKRALPEPEGRAPHQPRTVRPKRR